jgi:hypothetical protein
MKIQNSPTKSEILLNNNYIMKKTLTLFAIASLLCACAETVTLSNGEEHILDRWTLNQEGSSETYEVEVSSTVAGVLCDQGVFGENLLDSDNFFSLLPGQTKTVTCCAGVKGVKVELDN